VRTFFINTFIPVIPMGFEEKLKDMFQIEEIQRYRSLQVPPESSGEKECQFLETQKQSILVNCHS